MTNITIIINYVFLCNIRFSNIISSNINIDWLLLTKCILVGQLGITF